MAPLINRSMNMSALVDVWQRSQEVSDHVFKQTMIEALMQLDVDQLGLQQCMTQGSYVLAEGVEISVLNCREVGGKIQANLGVFFKSVIAGCNCADDPSPMDELNEYCELQLELSLNTGQAGIRPV